MAAYLSRPDFWLGFAFNRDPGDGIPLPNWSNFTALLRQADSVTRGHQYELAQSIAGQPSLTLRDTDENLNPGNPLGAYAGLVQPYREACWLAQWPNGAAGNLLNLGAWRVPIDPSFESYTVGQSLPWVGVLTGSLTSPPLVGSTTPHTGSRDLTYTQSGANDAPGVYWPIACIPGRQYTSTLYVRQSMAISQFIGVGGLTMGLDAFGRTVANGWGNSDVGGAWTATGGAAADYSVGAGHAAHSLTSVNVPRMTTITAGSAFTDMAPAVYLTPPVVAAGASIRAGVLARALPASPIFYAAVLDFNPDMTVTLSILRNVVGTEVVIASTVISYTYTPGVYFGIRLDVTGRTVSARAWPETTVEPSGFLLSVVDTAGPSGTGAAGCYSKLTTGNTNTLPVQVVFRDFGCGGTSLGNQSAATGAYNRLTVTFTATQPTHTVSLRSFGGVAGNVVLIDDIQHEQGGSASAFTTSGPVIYPVMRNYAERFTRTWDSAGFEGFAQVPCTDALAVLAGISIQSEYLEAVLATVPFYHWTLGSGTSTVQYPDVSGNQGPPLLAQVSKYGAGTAPAPGIPMGIPGDQAATGVGFTPDSPPNTTTQKATILAAGPQVGQTPFAFPPVLGGTWTLTIAAWVQYTTTSPATVQSVFRLAGTSAANTFSANAVSPIGITVDGTGNASAAYLNVDPSGTSWQLLGPSVPCSADGVRHLVVASVTQSAATTSVSVSVDGGAFQTNTYTTSTSGGVLIAQATAVQIGGTIAPGGVVDEILNGAAAHCTVWRRALSAAEVTNLGNAGRGYTGETSGARVARHLAMGGYIGATRISAGSSTMGPPSYQTSVDLLSDTQQNTQAELGANWIGPDGAVVFEGRNDRYLRTVGVYLFGENGGEVPYQDNLLYDDDPTFVYGDVQVTRSGGATCVGGDAVTIAAVGRRFFNRPFRAVVDLQTDAEAQDYAHWVFYTHDTALQRIQGLTLDPASNPALWPVVFGVEVGQRVTVARRPKAANAGAGLTMSSDYFIEQVSHSGIDMDAGTWLTGLLLSPIGAAPGTTFQPWILGDATYGVLGVTTIPGF